MTILADRSSPTRHGRAPPTSARALLGVLQLLALGLWLLALRRDLLARLDQLAGRHLRLAVARGLHLRHGLAILLVGRCRVRPFASAISARRWAA